jgi:hypothetical protein
MSSHLEFLNSYSIGVNLKTNLEREFHLDKKKKVFSLQQLCSFSLYNKNNENKETLKHTQKLALDTFRGYLKNYEPMHEVSSGQESDLYTPYLEEIISKHIELEEYDTALQLIDELIYMNKSVIIISSLIHKIIEKFIKNKKFDDAKKLLILSKELLFNISVASDAFLKQVTKLNELNTELNVFDENEVTKISQKINYLLRVTNLAYLF